MKNKIVLIIIFAVSIIVGFGASSLYVPKHIQKIGTNEHILPGNRQKGLVLKEGNVECYNKLLDSIKNDTNTVANNYFYYAFVMANKYNYAPANYHVYQSLISIYNKDTTKMDADTRKWASFYLSRGAKMGDKNCLKIINKR
jgi:hypothetical protein